MENYGREELPLSELLMLKGTYGILYHMNGHALPTLYGYLNEPNLGEQDARNYRQQIREIRSLAQGQVEMVQGIIARYPTSSVVQEYWVHIERLSAEIAGKTTDEKIDKSGS